MQARPWRRADDAFQLPVGNGKIRGYDHHDGTLIVCGGNHFGKIVGGVKKLSSHFSSLYGKIPGCAEIGLYKNAQGIDFPVQGNEPGGASDSALEAIADRALSGAHGTLFEIRAGMLQGFFYMAFIYRPAADVIDAAVVAFSYYRIDGMYGYSFFFAALNSMGDQSVGHKADIQGIGESDRSFQTAQFLYLGKPAGFAEAVLDKTCGDRLGQKWVFRAGKNDGNSGFVFRGGNGGMAYQNALYIGYFVERAGLHAARGDGIIPDSLFFHFYSCLCVECTFCTDKKGLLVFARLVMRKFYVL